MIRVAITGINGRMGKAIAAQVAKADDLKLVCGIDLVADEHADTPVYASIDEAIAANDLDVIVDFTNAKAARVNLPKALAAGVNCVVGTTGLANDELQAMAEAAAPGTALFFAPNFTTGAVLMMQFAKAAAPYFPEAEVIEFHHCNKKDAPSGTAVLTARMIGEARGDAPSTAPGKETEIAGAEGARGALIDGVPVHSVRSMGFVASQEVILGGMGQTLTIRHDSWDTGSYMPGIMLGIREAMNLEGLVIGLESIMNL